MFAYLAERWGLVIGDSGVGGAGSIYLGIASVMKSRILRREWPAGARVPSIDDLCQEFGVARATARQALHVLVSENLVSSHRGRGSFVVYEGPVAEEIRESLLEAISPTPRGHSIDIHSIEDRDALPLEMRVEGRAASKYKRITKVHSLAGVPYGVFEVFVASDVFRRFPRGAERKQKLAWLMREEGFKVTTSHERLTIHPADMHEARSLQCQLAQPVARLVRIMESEEGRVIYAAYNSYRGDFFLQERKITIGFTADNKRGRDDV
jgi:GntR family transcriptional regulator